jgi:DNA-binding response OmpR family regulator
MVDMVPLDRMTPDLSGDDGLERIREDWSNWTGVEQ